MGGWSRAAESELCRLHGNDGGQMKSDPGRVRNPGFRRQHRKNRIAVKKQRRSTYDPQAASPVPNGRFHGYQPNDLRVGCYRFMIQPISMHRLLRRHSRRILHAVSRRVTGTVTHIATMEPLVALTFDDGPNPDATPALLDLLDAFGAKATFFMVGAQAAAHPDLVERVRSAGHEIGNHSWSHPSFPMIPRKERLLQLRRCSATLRLDRTRLFRPPYGHQSALTQWEAKWAGYEVITWDVCLPDWETHDGSWLADLAIERISPGSIVLMHDGLFDFLGNSPPSRTATLEAVEQILRGLGDLYRFVTIPELWRFGKPVRENWWMQPDVAYLNQLSRNRKHARRYPQQQPPAACIGFNR